MVISQPSVTVTKIPASLSQSNEPQRVLFIGQQLAAGTATTGVLYTEIENGGQEDTLFGAKSQIAAMIRAGKLYNQETRFDAIPLDDGGAAVAATSDVVFAGTASVAWTLYITIGSETNHKYTVAVANLDDETAVGDTFAALVTADTNAPFSASNAAGTVTITAANKGTVANFNTVKYTGLVTGITTTINAFTSGATDPSLTSIFDVIAGERYQAIVFPAQYGYTFVTTLLDARFNTTNDILDGVGFTCLTDAYADLVSAATSENSPSLVIFGNKEIAATAQKGSVLVEFDYVIAAQFAAIRALRLTDGTNIASYVNATGGLLDATGGAATASLPYFNTPFANLEITGAGLGFSQTEIEGLLTAGVSVIGNNRAANTVISGEVATTYKTDASGNADATWKYLNSVDNFSAVAEYNHNNLKSDFTQSRLTEGDLVAGRTLANEAKIRAAMTKYYSTLSGADYVLTEAGPTALKYFKDNLTVTINKVAQSATITAKVPIVTQLRAISLSLQVKF